MTDSNGSLTLEGLAQILRDHMGGTSARFGEVANQFAEVRSQLAEGRAQDSQLRARIEDLRGELGNVAVFFRELAQIVLRQVDELAEYRRASEEHRRDIRQIFSRMEQQDARIEEMNREFRTRMAEHDARFEEMSRDIRSILNTLERRGGDGGRHDP